MGNSSPTSYGLVTAGKVQIQGQGAGVNRVLTSDNVGNATWEALSTSGGVSGSGTLNFIPKWTPDGATIGNSQLFDNGTSIGLGTVSPNARFDLPNTSGTIRGAFINNSSTSNQSSALLVQSNNITGGGAALERSGITSFLAPFLSPTFDYGAPTAIKAFASSSASLGTGGGIGILGSSGAGYGVAALSGIGTALLAQSVSGGYAIQTFGKVQIIGQGAAAGNILTSDAAGNATWQAPVAKIGISLRTLNGGTTVPNGVETSLLWGNVLYEDGGANYNPITGEYTVPAAGVYSMDASILWNAFGSSSSFTRLRLYINGNFETEQFTNGGVGIYFSNNLAFTKKLNAGDKINVTIYQASGNTQTIGPGYLGNTFSVTLIH